MDIRQQKTVTREVGGKKEAIPAVAPAYCLEKVSRPWYLKEELEWIR